MGGFLVNNEGAEENVTGFIDYLKVNIFQKFTVTFTVRFTTFFNCAVDEDVYFRDASMRTDDWIRDLSGGGRFKLFSVGDQLEITNAANTGNNSSAYGGGGLLISEKIDDDRIRCVDLLGVALPSPGFQLDASDAQAKFTLVQDPTGISFDFGLPENSATTTFGSPIDGELMRHQFGQTAAPLPALATLMIAQGLKSWQLGRGSVTVENTTTSAQRDNDREYQFEVVQEFFLFPFYLETQRLDWNTFPLVPFPSYFDKQNCLKEVFRIRAYRDLADPNVYQELSYDIKDGQTGWDAEQYNGGVEQFGFSNLAYSNTLGRLTRDDVVTITLEIDDIDSDLANFVCLNFIMLPEKDVDYKNINSTILENYVWDRVYLEQGGATLNGENFSTGFQVITSATAATKVGSKISITFTVDFGNDAKLKIDSLSEKFYVIQAYAGSGGLTAETANYNGMWIDYQQIGIEIPDSTAVATSDILFHDQNNNAVVNLSPKIKVEDEITVDTLVLLDQSAPLNTIQIDKVNLQLVAINSSTGEEAILQTEQVVLVNEPLVGTVRFINTTTPTNFQVNALEIRANDLAFRSNSQDTGNKFAYRFQHTFLFRWEYWEQLFLTTLPADFTDNAEPFNGYNQDWIRLAGFANWDINYRVETKLSIGSTIHTIQTDTILVDKDYNADVAVWTTVALNTFDVAAPLTHSGNPYILSNKRTKVQAVFTNVSATPGFDETGVFMVARLIPKENGDFENNNSFSSVYDRESAINPFDSDGGAGKIVITKVGADFTGTFYIDHTKLPVGVLEHSISVSINRNTAAPALADWGEVFVQDVLSLAVIVPPPTIEVPNNPFKICCLPIKVLASTGSTDVYLNDFFGAIKLFPLQYTVTMNLEKYDAVTDTWSSVSVLTNELGQSKNNLTYYGNKVEWHDVMLLGGGGVGKYRVVWNYGSGLNIYSNEYCLFEYTTDIADNTVRFEYILNSVIGDKRQTVTIDYVGLKWPSQLRVCDAIFNDRAAPYEVESVRQNSGRERSILKKFQETYKLEIRQAPRDLFDILMYEALMADDLLVSDYNSANNDTFVDVAIEVNGSFEPDNSNSRPFPSGSLDFISRYSNNRKDYS